MARDIRRPRPDSGHVPFRPDLAKNPESHNPVTLEAARTIAAEKSGQTGKNLENFRKGMYDHAYGVQCVLAGINLAMRAIEGVKSGK